MLRLVDVTYHHPNRDVLFSHINVSIEPKSKIALVGNNGAGKSTMLQLMAGSLQPTEGDVLCDESIYYIPQTFGQYNHLTVAEALRIDQTLKALKEIISGDMSEKNLALLNDDWSIEERCEEALQYWELEGLDLFQKMGNLSGGQRTKVFLAGIMIHQPKLLLLDEPSNHLDSRSRKLLYDFIASTNLTLIVVSHDRALLNMLSFVYELDKEGITAYGGNYEFCVEQKQLANEAFQQQLKAKEKDLRKAREVERESKERQQKLDARGKKKQEKAGLPTISMNTFRNNAEKSTARSKAVHSDKTGMISEELNALRKSLPAVDQMKLDFDQSGLHKGKVLITATEVNFAYNEKSLWRQNLNFQVTSGERIAIKGSNGSGKTTLVKLMLGKMAATAGELKRADFTSVYIDQDYTLLEDKLTVYQQAEVFNTATLAEHEVKSKLNRFLFGRDDWDKHCASLSGGERMRLMLCCLTISNLAPDLMVLDEPTNNLDIRNVDILTSAVKDYEGTLLVISHDEYFLEQIGISAILSVD